MRFYIEKHVFKLIQLKHNIYRDDDKINAENRP